MADMVSLKMMSEMFFRLELKLLRTEKAVAVHSGVDDKSFAIDLLQRLCRSYLAAEDSRVQVNKA